jgi:hypothetical protein
MTGFSLDRSDVEDGCLSDLALDQLITGDDKGTPHERECRAHLAQCRACVDRFARLEREAAVFRAAHPRLGSAPRRVPSRRSRWIAGMLTVAGAVAAIALFRAPAPSEVRLKGGAIDLEVFAKGRGAAVAPLLAGGAVHPGDALRFRLTAHRAGYAGIVSVDGARRAQSYGVAGEWLYPVAANEPVLLDGSIVLDGVLGREELLVFLCRGRLATDRLVRAVQAAVDSHASGPAAFANLGLDCARDAFWFTKAAPP